MSNGTPTPRITRTPRLALVWIVPLVALAVGGWMILREFKTRGPVITIDFADGSGIEAGKTVLEHKGVAVGQVTAVRLKPDHSGVEVSLRLDRDAAWLATAGAEFWIVHPEIGLSGVRGLDTLLTGPHLAMRSRPGEPATHFTGLDRIPPPEPAGTGRSFILQSDHLGSLGTGSPVFYREFKVGTVSTTRLSDDATRVLVRIHLEAPYANLVRTNTRFWNAGGFTFKIGLLGAEMKNTSLESLISGRVAFATPEELAPPAPEGAVFALSGDPDKEWLKWAPRIPINSPETVSDQKAAPASKQPSP